MSQFLSKKPAANTINNQVQKEEIKDESISLFFNPFQTIYYLSIIVIKFLKRIFSYILQNILFFLLIILLMILPRVVAPQFNQQMKEITFFVIWWVGLGIASSIGFGTGLHTFILYLGPHIAKVTLVANECTYIPEYKPSRWNMLSFNDCPIKNGNAGFFDVLLAVQLEAFLWGFGTAIGELPPYFVARTASLAKQYNEEVKEIEVLLHTKPKTFAEKIKHTIVDKLQRYAFITVLLCASIPNPLFDLAGLTCGHFLIPFKTFFSATCIGKAIIKVHIQMIFVIFVFSKHHVEAVIKFLESNIPFMTNKLTEIIEKQKKVLHSPDLIQGEKPIIAQIWDYVILAMILFFVYSIINSLANKEKNDEKIEEKIRKNI